MRLLSCAIKRDKKLWDNELRSPNWETGRDTHFAHVLFIVHLHIPLRTLLVRSGLLRTSDEAVPQSHEVDESEEGDDQGEVDERVDTASVEGEESTNVERPAALFRTLHDTFLCCGCSYPFGFISGVKDSLLFQV